MKKWIPHLMIIAILIVGTWYVHTHKRSTNNSVKQQDQISSTSLASCPNFDSAVQTVASLKKNDSQFTEKPKNGSSEIPYKRSSKEPYVTYRSSASQSVVFSDDSLGRVVDQFKKQATLELAKLGLVANASQDSVQKLSETNDTAYLFGFNQNDQLYMFIFDNIVNGDGATVSVNIECGKRNSDTDKIYDKILSQNNYQSAKVLSLYNEIDGLYMLNVHNGYAGGGGVTDYWKIKDGVVKNILTSQDYPPCKLLEENKVGKGLDCMNFDVNDSSVHKVNY